MSTLARRLVLRLALRPWLAGARELPAELLQAIVAIHTALSLLRYRRLWLKFLRTAEVHGVYTSETIGRRPEKEAATYLYVAPQEIYWRLYRRARDDEIYAVRARSLNRDLGEVLIVRDLGYLTWLEREKEKRGQLSPHAETLYRITIY